MKKTVLVLKELKVEGRHISITAQSERPRHEVLGELEWHLTQTREKVGKAQHKI